MDTVKHWKLNQITPNQFPHPPPPKTETTLDMFSKCNQCYQTVHTELNYLLRGWLFFLYFWRYFRARQECILQFAIAFLVGTGCSQSSVVAGEHRGVVVVVHQRVIGSLVAADASASAAAAAEGRRVGIWSRTGRFDAATSRVELVSCQFSIYKNIKIYKYIYIYIYILFTTVATVWLEIV